MNIDSIYKGKGTLKPVVAVFLVVIMICSILPAAMQGFEFEGTESRSVSTEEKETFSSPPRIKERMDEERLIFEDVDKREGMGKYTSIGMTEDHRYISYYSEGDGSLKLARGELPYAFDGWTTWTIDNEGDVGRYSSLDVVSGEDGVRVHIAYHDASEERLMHSLFIIDEDTVNIHNEEVDPSGGKYASLALDDEGSPHISYRNEKNGSLMYAEPTEDGWDTEEVMKGGGEGVGLYSSLDIDSNGRAHIAHYDWLSTSLVYSAKEGNDWHHTRIGEGERLGRYASLVLDEDDNAHISCYSWKNEEYRLNYVTNAVQGWNVEVVDEDTDFVGTYTSIDLTGEHQPVISYHQWDEENLRLAWRDEDGWTEKRVDSHNRAGSHTSLMVGDEGIDAHVAYHDKTHEDLLYVRVFLENRTPFAPQNFSTYSEYGEIVLEWEPPIYDGLYMEEDGITGYHIYRKMENKEDGYELIEKNYSSPSNTYRDFIPVENENDTYLFKIAAANRKGPGDHSTVLRTRAKYFDHIMIGTETNKYEIQELFPLTEGEEGTDIYEIRWDFDHDESEGVEWDVEKTGVKEAEHSYKEVGLKSVMLEIESNDIKRRCLQSAWVLGEYYLKSSYMEHDSNEVFLHMSDAYSEGLSDFDIELKNTYRFLGHRDLPYRAVNFTSPELEDHSIGGDDMDEPPDSEKEGDMAIWNHEIVVSDAGEDTKVVARPVLYNRHRDSLQNPFGSYRDETKYENSRDISIISTPRWTYHLFEEYGELTMEIDSEDGDHHGWTLEFEPKIEDDEGEIIVDEFINLSSVMPSNISKLGDFFGGDYGFELEVWPDEKISFTNEEGVETEILRFVTELDEDEIGPGEFDGNFGESLSFSGDSDIGASANIKIYMVVNIEDREIKVQGSLEVELGAEISIDIPLKSIGIAEVGLTAGIGSEIGVEFDIGGLSYDLDQGMRPIPGDGNIPLEMKVEFGGGPYAEAAGGLARVEGKFICGLTVGLEIPDLERELTLCGRFEVVAEAMFGLWERSRSWPLYSSNDNSYMMHDDLMVEREIFSTDRLFTRNYDSLIHEVKGSETSEGVTYLSGNVGPDSTPQINFVDEDSGLVVWRELTDHEGGLRSRLYSRTYDGNEWMEKEEIEDLPKTAYSPELVKLNEDELMMFYMGVDKELDEDIDKEEFFKDNFISSRRWSPSEGWSEPLLQHFDPEGEPISNFDVTLDHEELYIAYRSGDITFDVLDNSTSNNGSVGLIWAELEEDVTVNKEWQIEELLPSTSIPSVKSTGEYTALSYIRNVPYGDRGEEDCYNKTVLVMVDESKDSLDEMESHSIRETDDTKSHTLLSEKNGNIVVSWVEDHSSIYRREVEPKGNGLIGSDISTVFSGRTVSALSLHKNESGEFYAFQAGENAVPMVIQSTDDGWGYLRYIFRDKRYSHGQSALDFDVETPRMIYVEEEEIIEGWHAAHYPFHDASDDSVEDQSEHENTGKLEGDHEIKHHQEEDMREYGSYIEFKDGRMKVPSAPALNVTEEHEDLTVSSLVMLEEEQKDGYLFLKEGSWAVKYQNNEIVVELWSGSEKESRAFKPQDVDLEGWFFLAVRYEEGCEDTSYLNVTVLNRYEELTHEQFKEHTKYFELENFGPVDSSSEPLILADLPGTVSMDDFRLVERYLPDASVMKICETPFPYFDRKMDIATQAVPPFVSFTSPEIIIAGEPMEFQGYSPSSDLNWTWTFDEEKLYGKNVEYTFNETGYQRVKLKAIHGQTGARAHHEKTLHVIDVNPPEFKGIEDHTVLDNNTVRLEWEKAQDVSEPITYRIHHVKGDQGFDLSRWSKSTQGTEVLLHELEPYVEHRVKITAVNDLGLENVSEPLAFTLQDDMSPEFCGLHSAYTSDHHHRTVTLEWREAYDHSPPITYNIYHSRDKNMSFDEPLDTTKSTRSDVSVSDLGLHHFAVRAEDSVGNEEKNEVLRSTWVNDTEPPSMNIINPGSGKNVFPDVFFEWEVHDGPVSKYLVRSSHCNWKMLEADSSRANYTFKNLPDGECTLKVRGIGRGGYHAEASVVVHVTSVESYSPPTIELRSPTDGARDISTSPTLNVDVEHPDHLKMDVSFYGFDSSHTYDEGKELIGVEKGVESGDTASSDWPDLEDGTAHHWYVVVDDGFTDTSSDQWTFTTDQWGNNTLPEVVEEYPEDGSEGVSQNTELSVEVFDSDGHIMNVSFYCDEEKLIGEELGVHSGDKATTEWNHLLPNTTYGWFVEVEDGFDKITSQVWYFETVEEDTVPEISIDPRPKDGSQDVPISPVLEVDVEHTHGGYMDVYFYGTSVSNNDFKQIGRDENVESGATASMLWSDLEKDTEYLWFVVVDDGSEETSSDTWSFETLESIEYVEIKEFEVDPIYGEAPLNVSITAVMENKGDSLEEIELEIIDNEVENIIRSWTLELEPGEELEVVKEHEFSEAGDHTIRLKEEKERVRVVEEMVLKPVSLHVPDKVFKGIPIWIEAVVENQGEDEPEVHLLVDGKNVLSRTIPPGDHNVSTEHTFDRSGEKEIALQDEKQHTLLRETIVVEKVRPEAPMGPRPKDGSSDISTSPTLQVDISHPMGESMDVFFYHESETIGHVENVGSGETAEVDWTGLKNSTTYNWFVEVEDGSESITSDTWSFTTSETGENEPPREPVLVSPEDGAVDVDRDMTLSVEVFDDYSERVDVLFYEDTHEKIGEVSEVSTGSEVELEWNNLSYNTTYQWYVEVDDGEHITRSDTWSFTTELKEDDTDEDGEDGTDDTGEDGADDTEEDREEERPLSVIQVVLVAVLVASLIVSYVLWKNDRSEDDDEDADADADVDEEVDEEVDEDIEE